MTKQTRTLDTHLAEKTTLDEALAFFAKTLDKPVAVTRADVLGADRSTYRLMDPEGLYDFGYVEKTRAIWKFTTPDGCVFRSKNADLIAIRAL